MKILVFDDSEIHRKAAALLLKEHDVTIVETYNEAEDALKTLPDIDYWDKLAAHAGLKEPTSMDRSEWKSYNKASKELMRKAWCRSEFDAVMTDLLVPASSRCMGDEGSKFVGQEMPLGAIIALRALAAGVRLVAVVTDTDHHDHPASSAICGFPDYLTLGFRLICEPEPKRVYFDEKTMELLPWGFIETKEAYAKYPLIKGTLARQGIVEGKAWDKILDKLIDG